MTYIGLVILFLGLIAQAHVEDVITAEDQEEAQTTTKKAVDKVIDLNRHGTNVLNSVPNAPCACALRTEPQTSPYEVCTTENSYLEKSLPKKTSLVVSKDSHAIDPFCILGAQRRFPDPGFAGTCATLTSYPKKNQARPCLSEKYLSFVYNSFSKVAKCFQIPEDEIFPSLALESGFHVNALGRNMDAGISQLTGDLIQAVNDSYFDTFLKKAQSSSKCTAILPYFKPLPTETKLRCAAMMPPNNPIQNLIYAAILFKTNHQVIETGVKSVKGKLPKDLDMEALIQALTVLSFNVAPGSIILTLRQFISSRGVNLGADDFKMTRDFPNTFASYMKLNFPVPPENENSRRNVISVYVPAALNLGRKIEGQIGGDKKCLPPGLERLL